MHPTPTSNSRSSCFSFPSTGIVATYHHVPLAGCFLRPRSQVQPGLQMASLYTSQGTRFSDFSKLLPGLAKHVYHLYVPPWNWVRETQMEEKTEAVTVPGQTVINIGASRSQSKTPAGSPCGPLYGRPSASQIPAQALETLKAGQEIAFPSLISLCAMTLAPNFLL